MDGLAARPPSHAMRSSPLSLHFIAEEKQQLAGDASVPLPLFTSRTRYARLTRRLRQLDDEARSHTAADAENERIKALHARGALGGNTALRQPQPQQPQQLDGSGSSEPAADVSTVDGLIAAVLTASSHSGHSAALLKQHYTGEALLHAMARLSQKDGRDDKQDAAAAAKRQQPLGQQQAGQGQTATLSALGRGTAQLQQVSSGPQPHSTTQQLSAGVTQQHLPGLSGIVTLASVASAGGGATAATAAAAVSRGALSAPTASVASLNGDSAVWSVGQSAQLSVQAVLDYYRSHPAARSELQSRVEALKAAKAAAASSAIDANKRSVGQRDSRREQTERSRQAELRRQQAAKERLRQAVVEAAAAVEAAQRLHSSSSSVRDKTAQHYSGFSHNNVPSEGGGVSADLDGGGVAAGGSSGDGNPLIGAAASDDWLDGTEDSASVDRRARLLWLSMAVPTAVGCTVWLERAKAVVIPRLAVELDADVDVSLSGLFHSALVARLQDSKDAALTVLKRSLANYGQRWQDKRRRKAATLILRFVTLVHTASAIRQALRDTSVLTHILRIQRWWKRHTAVLQAQCVVVSKKWRRREAAIARQQLHSSSHGSHSQGPTTPSSGQGGAGGGGGGGLAGGQTDHRDVNSRDRRRQLSFDARAGRHRATLELQQPALNHQREASGGSGSAVSGVSGGGTGNLGGQPASVSASDASAYKAIPRSAQQQAVSHLLALRRAAHRRRLRVYFAQLAGYEQQYAQQLELIRTRRLLGMDGSEGSGSGPAIVAQGSSTTAGHTLALPPAPVRPVFPLVPATAEMDRLLIAASRSYFLSRLAGFRPPDNTQPPHLFAAPHRDAPSDELVDFTPAFCTPHNPNSALQPLASTAAFAAAAGSELSRVVEESESAVQSPSSQLA